MKHNHMQVFLIYLVKQHYASIKVVVLAYSKSIGRDLGKYRIRRNAILPYFIKNPMIKDIN